MARSKKPDPPAPASTTRRLVGDAAGYELLIVSKDGARVSDLPERGALVIGRTSEAEVRLAGSSVSRRHATLRIALGVFTIEDLHSANGTVVRGRRAPVGRPVELTPGDSVQVGEYVLVVQPRRPLRHTRHVWPPEYLEARITEQCERGRRGDAAAFHVLRLHVDDTGVDPAPQIAAELGSTDVLARLAPGAWGVLLVDQSEREATLLAQRLTRVLGDGATTSLFGYPRDATSAGALMARLIDAAGADGEGERTAKVILCSPAMRNLDHQLESVAHGAINVLILGETGVGKDVMAQRLHERSPRSEHPLLRVNCAALTEPLLESELFGHERGAFTGAVRTKPGLLETAVGGTVFLDEIGELPLVLQAKLLQVLEHQVVLRVGSVKPRPIDVRFVAATNRDLEREVASGRFRSDLYYRLAGFTMVIPPLRERRDDILPLADEMLRRAAIRLDRRGIALDPEAAALVRDYPWPGNVRELRNVIERAVMLSGGRTVTVAHLPTDKMRSVVLVEPPARLPPAAGGATLVELTADELVERQQILDVLARCAGNQSRAAAELGWSRSTLLIRLDAYRIQRPRKRRG